MENRFQKVEALRGQSPGSGGYRPRTAQQTHVQSSFGRVTFMQVVWIQDRGGDARAMRVQSSLGREGCRIWGSPTGDSNNYTKKDYPSVQEHYTCRDGNLLNGY